MSSYQRTTPFSSVMSSPAISSAASDTSNETNPMPRRVPSTESLPLLFMTGRGSQASSTTATDDLSQQADDILEAPNTAVTAGPAEPIRGTTALSMALHDVVEEPVDPMSMWMDNTDNARLERLFVELSKEPKTNETVERWLASQETSLHERASWGSWTDLPTTLEIERWRAELFDQDVDAAFTSEANAFPSSQ